MWIRLEIIFAISTLISAKRKRCKPNFILFSLDDVEYTQSWQFLAPPADLNGESFDFLDIATPNINSIIDEGITIPRSYSAAPMCAPSRFGFLTGRYTVRSINAIRQTLENGNGAEGTRITVPNTVLIDDDDIYNIQSILKSNSYYTGHIGKWHLSGRQDDGLGCNALNRGSNQTLYDQCIDLIKQKGFDFVSALYYANIRNADFFHNPEWKVQEAMKFIHASIVENKPFFLNFAATLAHGPRVYTDDNNRLLTSSLTRTPRGILTGNDIPNPSKIGMETRENIWNMVLNSNININDPDELNYAAELIWIDNALGALINYLKDLQIYDNTFFVVMNDHGQWAKSTLFEHGTRIIQSIRYPPKFGTNGHVLPDDFIVANYDLPAVIAHLANIRLPSEYIMDGKNWLKDVTKFVRYFDKKNRKKRRKTLSSPDYEKYPPKCCRERYFDIEHSRGMVTKSAKYIFRATPRTARNVNLYANGHDMEQIYVFDRDPNEQNNEINNAEFNDMICMFKTKMVDYIQNIACPANDINDCIIPELNMCDVW